jgi:GH43 family beta-xylosidase
VRTAALALAVVTATGCTSAARHPIAKISNPVITQRADPSVYKHTDGYYYLTDSVPDYDIVELRRATTLHGLATATPIPVFHVTASGPQSGWIWAPDIRFYDGAWYIYYSASPNTSKFDQRIYSMRNTSPNPMIGAWTQNGQLTTEYQSFTIDATSFTNADGLRYLLWAQKDPAIRANSNIYIARLSTPTAITGQPTRLSVPTYPWETVGFAVNEAPAVLQKNGKIFVTYSSSATDANYTMGLLTVSDKVDILNAANWTKSPTPVFQTSAANSVYGPGSNSFTVSANGVDDINVYNARSYPKVTDPLTDRNRSIRMQKVNWNPDGTPNFGLPVAAGQTAE